MKNVLDYIDIILLAILLLFLFFYFKRLLGQKVGYQRKGQEVESSTYSPQKKLNENTVDSENNEVEEYTYPIGSLMQKLEVIESHDDLFTPKTFINSSKKAFEMILKSFNSGKLTDVKDFLSSKVYDAFNSSIEARPEDKKELHVEIKQFVLSEIVDVKINDNFDTFISVKYITLQAKGMEDKKKIVEISETWVFSKNIKENKSIWKLVKTY